MRYAVILGAVLALSAPALAAPQRYSILDAGLIVRNIILLDPAAAYTPPTGYTARPYQAGDMVVVSANAPDVSQVFALQSDLTALQASMAQPCVLPPAPDTLLGTVGTSTACSRRSDSTRPTAVQAAAVVTDASGNWTVTFAKSFANAPAVDPLPINTGSLPIMCNVVSRSVTGATGKCWQANTATLGGSLTALLNAVVNVFGNAAANTTVMVLARDMTQ